MECIMYLVVYKFLLFTIYNIMLCNNTIKYIDLFCGLGAFHIAFNNFNSTNNSYKYKCVMACDLDKRLQKIYSNNFDCPIFGDINDISLDTIPNFDILCAGFPCQPFSLAGKKEGFNNTKSGNLFFKILEIIDYKKPNILLLENVKNIVSIESGVVFKKIITLLKQRDYYINWKSINSKDYGSAQSRIRVYIVATKKNPYIFSNNNNNNSKVINDILDRNCKDFIHYTDKYYLKSNKTDNNVTTKSNCKMLYRLINKSTGLGGRQGERIYSIDYLSPTICKSSGGLGKKTGLYWIDNKIRRLNVFEVLRLFNFPNNYKFINIVSNETMIGYLGNSIVISVLENIINNLNNKHL